MRTSRGLSLKVGALDRRDGAAARPEDIRGVKLVARAIEGVGGKDLRGIAEDFRKQVGSGVVGRRQGGAERSGDGRLGGVEVQRGWRMG